MKKILSLILLATLFVACGSDDEYEPEYYNPVEGRWVYTYGKDYKEIRIYNVRFVAFSEFVKNGEESITSHGSYSVDAKYIYHKNYTHGYMIVADTLWLKNLTSEGWDAKYIREKEESAN